MRLSSTLAVLAVLAVLAALSAAGSARAQDLAAVTISSGAIAGIVEGDVVAFRGIPYAAPPIGDLRWRAPQAVTAWAGVRAAREPGHDCMQIPFDDPVSPLGTTPSEDCLVLNVWRPAEASAPLPVMVWIPGGWFVNGGSSTALSDGSSLARQGVVAVTINYRLGRFGFFAHPALIEAAEGPVGNFGYMDQIAALEWVRDNIGAFGGDPDAVTVVGESAGGASVLHLLTSSAAHGLFRGAMVMSGGGRYALAERSMTGGTADRPSADMADEAFAAALGISGSGPTALATLRALPAEDLTRDITFPVFMRALLTRGVTEFEGTPMIDGVTVTDRLESLIRNGEAAAVPVIVGTTALDAPGYFPPLNDPFSMFGNEAAAAAAAFNPGGALPPELVLLGISADMTMHEPARFVARSVTGAGNPAWLYRFSYAAESRADRANGAAHAQELPFMFGTVEGAVGEAITDKDRAMAAAFGGYVANFVKTGDPNGGTLPRWPAFDPAAYDLMHFTLDDGPVFGADPRAARVALVERAAEGQL
ncbi:MAG: carboxylesterase family protein [Bauldia sp.]|nr:carboxylesterase family protein [Bauldia sp.]